jgi:squalene synthase HpnC
MAGAIMAATSPPPRGSPDGARGTRTAGGRTPDGRAPDPSVPDVSAVMGRVSGENFPVASRVLGRRMRAHLLALYGFARLVDELGDGAPPGAGSPPSAAERLAALDELERDLGQAFQGGAQHPLMQRLQPTLRECSLPRGPFVRLIEANRVDQRVSRYETWEQLRGYCELSANPIGELVLGVFAQATPARVALSDAICTALQLAEHCQDVAEDRDRGRVYLPLEDMARCGCTLADLSAEHAGEPLRRTVALEIARARELLARGAPLIDDLHGPRERLAVAAFVAGGRAALDAIERAGCDVLAGAPRAGTGRRLLALVSTLVERRR